VLLPAAAGSTKSCPHRGYEGLGPRNCPCGILKRGRIANIIGDLAKPLHLVDGTTQFGLGPCSAQNARHDANHRSGIFDRRLWRLEFPLEVDDTIPLRVCAVGKVRIGGDQRWKNPVYTHIAEMKNHGIRQSKLSEFVALCTGSTLNWKLGSSHD
jgi:hypothetical protein